MKKRKQLLFISISLFIFTNINIFKSEFNNLRFLLTISSQTLANAEAIEGEGEGGEGLWDKTKFTKTEVWDKTRKNDENRYTLTHKITCTKGGIEPECSELCETTTEENGIIATPWKECES